MQPLKNWLGGVLLVVFWLAGRAATLLQSNAWEATAAIGAAAAFAGLWMIYPPAALLIGGVALIAFAFWGAKSWAS